MVFFNGGKATCKIEKIQERVLTFVNNDYNSDYSVLLSQSRQVTMEVKRMRHLCIKIYKTLNGLNPSYRMMSSAEMSHCTLSEEHMTYQFPE